MAALGVDKVYRFVQFASNKETRGWVSPAEFNIAAELAQIAAYSKREAVFLQTKKVLNDMRPFMKLSAAITPSVGICAYPADLRHFLNAWKVADYKPITELTQGEFSGVMDSSIVPPSSDYLACVQRDDGLYIYPATSTADVQMEYIKIPTAPEWAYTTSSGRPVYDSGNSTDFEFDEISFLEISTNILLHVGLNIKDDTVAQYGAAFNQQA